MLNNILLQCLVIVGLLIRPQAGLTPGLYITTPKEGEQLQGVVEVIGSVPEVDFNYAEVSYGYGENTGNNWFIIKRIENPLHDVVLAQWDTTTITDGLYQLKLVVHRNNGVSSEIILKNLQVRNYSSTGGGQNQPETNQIQNSETPSETNNSIVGEKNPTPIVPNPIGVGKNEFSIVLISSAVVGVLLLILTGVYAFFRSISKRE